MLVLKSCEGLRSALRGRKDRLLRIQNREAARGHESACKNRVRNTVLEPVNAPDEALERHLALRGREEGEPGDPARVDGAGPRESVREGPPEVISSFLQLFELARAQKLRRDAGEREARVEPAGVPVERADLLSRLFLLYISRNAQTRGVRALSR